MNPASARAALQSAREAFHRHADDCARWSYEDPEGHDQQGEPCPDCVRTMLALHEARKRLRAAEGREP